MVIDILIALEYNNTNRKILIWDYFTACCIGKTCTIWLKDFN